MTFELDAAILLGFGAGVTWLLIVWHKAGTLGENRLALVVASCISVLGGALLRLLSSDAASRLGAAALSIGLLPATYIVTKALLRRPRG